MTGTLKKALIHLTPNQHAALKTAARQRDVTISQVVREAIVYFLDLESEIVIVGRPFKASTTPTPPPTTTGGT